jgi:hypothetical protein
LPLHICRLESAYWQSTVAITNPSLDIPNRLGLAGLFHEMGQRDFAQSVALHFIELAA